MNDAAAAHLARSRHYVLRNPEGTKKLENEWCRARASTTTDATVRITLLACGAAQIRALDPCRGRLAQ
jgi:hypothetical protein